MPGTIKVKEVVRRISALLQDNNPQFTRMPETEIIDFLNDAQRAIYTYLPSACSRVDAVRLVPGTLQSIESIAAAYCKPGDGSIPTVPVIGSLFLDILCNMGADGLTAGRVVRPIPDGRELLDTLSPMWHSEAATAIKGFVFDPRMPRHFHVTPGIHATTQVWVRMAWVAVPLLIPNTGTPGSELYASGGASTTTITVVNYTCARLLMKNAQYGASTGMSVEAFAALFTGSINAKATAIMGYNPNLKKLPFAPTPVGAAS